ncbi:MAG TPA: hypothetical protein VF727_04945 [Allosphingosinicella sp.]|jgi:hypothetical protein
MLDLMDAIIAGADTSLAAAGELEVAIDTAFPNDERAQKLVTDLALYRSGGGEFLWNTPEMQRRLADAREHLSKLWLQAR